MAKNIFQKSYNFFKNIRTPKWLRVILEEIQDILVQIMLSVGREYLKQIKDKIIEIADKDISDKQKFEIVFKFGKDLIPSIKDSAMNLLIETLVAKLKKDSVI